MDNYLLQLTGRFVVQRGILSHHELIDLALDPAFSEEKTPAIHEETLEFPSLKSSPVPPSSFRPLTSVFRPPPG